MQNAAIAVLFLFSLVSQSIGQIELSYTAAKSLVGATSPRLVGDRILIGEDSKPQISPVAVLKVKSSEKFRIKARKSLFENAELIALAEDEFLLFGEGEYLVEAISLNHERSLKVLVGSSPSPTPTPTPTPTPDPPKPDVNVANEYNVGVVAFTKAPSDPTLARQIATYYRTNASRLFGQGGLSDIQTVLNQITKEFDLKQCFLDKIGISLCLKWRTRWRPSSERKSTSYRQAWLCVSIRRPI